MEISCKATSSMFPSKRGLYTPSAGEGGNREEKRGNGHAKCRHLQSKRIFHVTFAKAKQTFAQAIQQTLKGLCQQDMPASWSCCLISVLTVLIAHFPLFSSSSFFSTFRDEILASICSQNKKKKARNSKLCVLFNFFSSVL